MKLFGVINMDIVGSRKVKDREKLQVDLDRYISLMNSKFEDILSAPITITLGDEWQAVISKPSEVYNVVHEFQKLLWGDGLNLYAGIGIGTLSTTLSSDTRKMDGPCFHLAREAMGIVKNVDKLKNKYSLNKLNKVFLQIQASSNDKHQFDTLDFYYTSKTSYIDALTREIAENIETEYRNNPSQISRLILERTVNLIIENNEVLKAKMTSKQKEVYISYSKLGSYRKVVEAIEDGVRETIGGISQKLNSASYFTIQRNHQIVSLLLSTCYWSDVN